LIFLYKFGQLLKWFVLSQREGVGHQGTSASANCARTWQAQERKQ